MPQHEEYQPDTVEELQQEDETAPAAVDVEVIRPVSVRHVPTRLGALSTLVVTPMVPTLILPADPTRSRALLRVYASSPMDVQLASDPGAFGSYDPNMGSLGGFTYYLDDDTPLELFHRDAVYGMVPTDNPDNAAILGIYTEHWAD